MSYPAPESVIGETALRDQAVDMRVPFQGTAKGMQDTDEAGSKVPCLVQLIKQTEDNGAYCLEKTVQERPVHEEKAAELFRDGEDTVAMLTGDQLSGHSGSPFSGVKVPAGGTETGMTAERYEFQMTAERASIHGATESGITTVDHLVNVFNFDRPRMQGIYDLFIMVTKYFLEYIHRSIMKRKTA